jgi:hypothetical protein
MPIINVDGVSVFDTAHRWRTRPYDALMMRRARHLLATAPQ